MRKSLLFLTFAASLAVAAGGRAEDSLFSRFPINTTFSSAPTSGGQAPAAATPRIVGGGMISDLVRQSGLEPAAAGDEGVALKIQRDKSTFPILLTNSPDKLQVVAVVQLSTINDEKQVSSAKLLELMSASRQHSPAFFGYSAKRKKIELFRTFDNQGLTAAVLRGELEHLVDIAKSTEPLWTVGSDAPVAAAAQTPNRPAVASAPAPRPAPTPAATSTAKPTATAAANGPLLGKWSASRSAKDAFAIHFKSDGSFVLVHVNDGKQVRSTGKFTLAGQQLTLDSKAGVKLQGSIQTVNQREFRFLPSNSTSKSSSLTFKRAA